MHVGFVLETKPQRWYDVFVSSCENSLNQIDITQLNSLFRAIAVGKSLKSVEK